MAQRQSRKLQHRLYQCANAAIGHMHPPPHRYKQVAPAHAT